MANEAKALNPSKHTGRISKLTPEVQKTFLEVLRLTGSYRAAANRIGVDPATVCDWKAKGETQPRGIYTEFRQACLRTMADRVTLSAGIHFRVSHGQIYKAPLRKREYTPRGDLIETNELALDKDGKPQFVDVCDAPDLKAIEWELSRIEPETYALKSGGVTVNNETNVAVPLLVDVLNEIGPLPEDATRKAFEAWKRGDNSIDVTAIDVTTESEDLEADTRAAFEAYKRGEN